MISKKTYIPAKPRSKKLLGGVMSSSKGVAVGAGGAGVTHTHANKVAIDQLTQGNIDVLSYLSLYQTGVEMEVLLDEFGDPVLDVNGNPVMVPVEVPVLDEFGQPVLDINGYPVTEQIPIYAIKSTATFFSEKEISAYGLGESEGTGGGDYNRLDSWVDYDVNKAGWVLSALLGVNLNARLTELENGGGTGGSVAWEDITGKPSTFNPAAHAHSMSDITGLSNALAAKFDTPTGTTSQYVRGNGSLATFPAIPSIPSIIGLSELNTGTETTQRTVSASVLSQWLSGKGYLTSISAHTHAISDITNLSSTLNNLVTLDTAQTVAGAKTFSAALTASVSVTTPKVIFAAAGWSVEQTGTEIQFKYNGVIKQRLLSDGSIVGIGEVTAFGSTS